MGIFTSPIALAGVTLGAVILFHIYSANARQKRYNNVGAGPPAILPSNTLGLNYVIQMFSELRKHRFWHWTKRLLDENNHTLQLHLLGANLLLTDDPENIKAIQDTQFWEVAKSKEQHEIFKHILGDAIFALNGEEWKQEAGLLRPHMNRVRQSDFEVTERHIQNAFKLLEEGVDAFDVIDRLQLDVVTEVFCGESTNSLTSDQQPFRNAMDTLLKVASFRQLLGKVGVYLKDEWIAPKAVAFIDNYLENFATKAYARNVRGKTAKDSLTLVDDLIVKGKRRADIKNAVTATLLAGKDPTTTSLAWAYYEIARHPYVFEKMREEVRDHIGFERLPVMSDLHKLKYIKTMIKETLRVHHPLGFNARVPVKDMTLPRGGGPDGKSPIAVLEGTQILYGLLSLQMREDLGVDDVSVWNPERWETWEPTNKWEFVPFNHGPRICLGQQFANFQMEYFFARLCQDFESVTLLPESPRQEGMVKLELNTKMAHPVFAKSVRRVKG
ncbi:cytochrome P450 [Aspergillus affinis]|uniref:cytochrome P450 n=1 Tax=Aspergillus affinis TaxID=1070780 RepID=UPI0022FDB658|nr:cytochrome P450 [Aspergillus affinis]KAI9046092.1 cytochrome P450 [Aspergillus affinis]